MIDKIVAFSVRNRYTVLVLVLALATWGAYSLTRLPIDAVPDVTSNQVDVITNVPSLAPLEIERFITAPIEMSMANIPGLVEVRSISKFGLSTVKLIFTDDTDVYWARAQIFERLDNVQGELPDGVKPFMGPVSTGLGEVFQYIIRPKDPKDKSYSLAEIRTIQDWVVRKKLLSVKGVADVSSFGGYRKEYQAKLDLERMRALNITTDEIFAALEAGNSNTGGAYIEKANRAYIVRGIGIASSLEDIANTIIRLNGKTPVLIKDVADVEFGYTIRQGALTMNGTGEVVGAVVMMVKGENGNAMIERIFEKMDEINEALPDGLEMVSFVDRAKLVNRAIGTVRTNLMEGALIVAVVILVFLGNWRASLLAVSLIPLSMLIAFGLMVQFDVAGTLMSLGAIDFGLLVDPAIIVVESVVLFLGLAMMKKGKGATMSYAERQDIVIAATKEVKQSVVFGGLIILIVYFPILTLEGIEGKMFGPMAKTVSFAIISALFLAITFVPMMSAWLMRPPADPHDHGFSEVIVQAIFKVYRPIAELVLRLKPLAIVFAAAVLLGGVLGFKRLGGEFIPKLAEGDFVIAMNLPIGTSLTETINLGLKIERTLMEEYPDEIDKIVSKVGTSEIPFDPQPLEYQEMVVNLKEKETWTKAKTQQDLAVLIAKTLESYPGLTISIQQPIENRVNELMSGARNDVVVKLFGNDLDTMFVKGNQIINVLKTVNGATDIQQNKIFGLPQINIRYDRKQMAIHGISVDQVNRALQMAFAGAVAGTIYENDKRFDLTLRLASSERDKVENIQNLLISNKEGKPIPLRELAEIRETIGPAEIGHENLVRRINLGFNVRGRDIESVVNEAIEKINQQIIIPKGYTVTFGGEFENLRRAKERLSIVLPVSLLIIFGLLYVTFNNVKESLLIYTVVPLSAVGGVFSLLIRDMNFSISAGVGFIALFGVAVLNGILLVSHFNTLRDTVSGLTIEQKVMRGLHERFRPVLMTSLVAALGFMPMALSTGAGAEVQKPLATVVIGGLFTATLLTLVVLPVLYAMLNKKNGQTDPPAYPASSGDDTHGLLLKTVIFLLISGAAGTASAQKVISVDNAINQAFNTNPEMRLSEQKIQREQALRPAAFNLVTPELAFEAPTGLDLRPGIRQQIAYPGVYVAQRQAQENRVELAQIEKAISQTQLSYKIRTSYNDLQFFLEKVRLLESQDSIYSDILRVNQVRSKVGQISNLEVINGESQYKRIQFNLLQAKAELRSVKVQFGLLLGTPGDTSYLPDGPLARIPPDKILVDTDTSFSANPMTRYNIQLEVLNNNLLKAEKRRRVPGVVVGFLNQGQPREETAPVFRGVYGITLPIWYWVQNANIKAAKKSVEAAKTQSTITNYQLSTNYAQGIAQFRQQRDNLLYFETAALPQAEEVLRSAKESFRLGGTSYYAYLQNIELAYQIRLNYIESLRQYNQAIIYINYLQGEI